MANRAISRDERKPSLFKDDCKCASGTSQWLGKTRALGPRKTEYSEKFWAFSWVVRLWVGSISSKTKL